ncbi:hypothetical protein DFP72DRAFT_582385 [Ephemerocybe angulata]|uniref:Uncharacterized protein n=1 Tax=Ephemerocybe angulata TaxID=980116 RepID=A0A8H6HL14_9AGAR|nr:hypothetical protein DFP72DRAFT_582385 [Tulosesus angulatus]
MTMYITCCSPLAERSEDIVPAPYIQHSQRLPGLSLAEQKVSSPEEGSFCVVPAPYNQHHDWHSFHHNTASTTHLTYDWLSHCRPHSSQCLFVIDSRRPRFPDVQKYQFPHSHRQHPTTSITAAPCRTNDIQITPSPFSGPPKISVSHYGACNSPQISAFIPMTLHRAVPATRSVALFRHTARSRGADPYILCHPARQLSPRDHFTSMRSETPHSFHPVFRTPKMIKFISAVW